jgi:signal peptidase I
MENPRQPWVAGALSLFGIGLGQLYNGQWRKTVAINLASLVLAAWTVGFARSERPHPGLALGVVAGVALQGFAFVDAVRTARRLGDDFVAPRFDRPLVYVGLVVVLGLFHAGLTQWIRGNAVQAFRIPSESMFPTLLVGDHLYVDRTAGGRRPSRGDVVAYSVSRTHVFLHRVVGLAGDTLEIVDKRVLRGGRPLDEPYVTFIDPQTRSGAIDPRDNLAAFVVPPGHVFVLGDNRDNSNDSRYQGPVPARDVLGRGAGIYWSWDPERREVRWDRLGRPARGDVPPRSAP